VAGKISRNIYVQGSKDRIALVGKVHEGYFGLALSIYMRRVFTHCPGYNIVLPDEILYDPNQELQHLQFSEPDLGDEVVVDGYVVGTLDFNNGAWTIEYKKEFKWEKE